jgi:hypothetical protein
MAGGGHIFGKPARRGPASFQRAVAERESGWPVAGRPDPDAARPGLRRLRAGGRRWTFALLVAAGLIGGCVALEAGLDRDADLLLRTGLRGDGTVLAITTARRAPTVIEIRYVAGGSTRQRWIDQTSDRRYAVGDHVVTDPARPDRIRTVDEPNQDRGAVTGGWLMLVVGAGLVPLAALRRVRWARRVVAARRTGWYPAVVTVAPHRRLAAADHRPPDLRIRYRDGTVVSARGAHAYGVAELADRPRREAWVAGRGENLAVLFPSGVKGNRPYLVPAQAVTGGGPADR